MSHLSKIFEEAPIKVQNRNGFDLSHVHAGTSKCGQLVPVLTKLLAPNSTISLGVQAEVNLPPLVTPFYGKVDFAVEGFVVPCSILYGGWKQFISNQEATQFPNAFAYSPQVASNTSATTKTRSSSNYYNSDFGKVGYALPKVDLVRSYKENLASAATLSSTVDNIYDFMGANIKGLSDMGSGDYGEIYVSLLPALAYHRIVDVFYRNTKLTRTWFAVNPNVMGPSTVNRKNVSLIWHSFYTDGNLVEPEIESYAAASADFSLYDPSDDETGGALAIDPLVFPDGVSIFSTRQRTYMRDYFTSAVASPQQGGASVLSFAVDASGSTGEFTINSLRMANSLQKFLETNNLSGDYAEMSRNRWGVRPIDADFEEPHYLGRVVIPVYQHTVYKQDALEGNGSGDKMNPFVADGYLGATAGVGKVNGEGSICDNFNVTCWSYLMCLASIYPHANYNFGLNRELTMTKLGDFPAPELQAVGMEDIKNYEIATQATTTTALKATFGYIPRYSRFKYMDDRVSGLLRPGENMQQYQLQRNFTGIPQLGTDFVTIAQNALDGVLAVNTATAKFTAWWEIYFKLHVVMPLSDFCIPTLGELQDTHTQKASVGGSRLS